MAGKVKKTSSFIEKNDFPNLNNDFHTPRFTKGKHTPTKNDKNAKKTGPSLKPTKKTWRWKRNDDISLRNLQLEGWK